MYHYVFFDFSIKNFLSFQNSIMWSSTNKIVKKLFILSNAASAPVVFTNLRKFTEYILFIRTVALQKFLLAKNPNETMRQNISEPFYIRTDEDGLFNMIILQLIQMYFRQFLLGQLQKLYLTWCNFFPLIWAIHLIGTKRWRVLILFIDKWWEKELSIDSPTIKFEVWQLPVATFLTI